MVAPAPIKEKVKKEVKKKVVKKDIRTALKPEDLPTPKDFMKQHVKISGDAGGDDDEGDEWDDFYSWTPPKTRPSGGGGYDSWGGYGKGAPPKSTVRDSAWTERKRVEPDKSKMLPPPPPPGGDDDKKKSEKKEDKEEEGRS